MFSSSTSRTNIRRACSRITVVAVIASVVLSACGAQSSKSTDTLALVKGAGPSIGLKMDFASVVTNAALDAAAKKLRDATIGNDLVEVTNLYAKKASDGTKTGTATLTFKKSELSLQSSFVVTDSSNWEVTVVKTSTSSKAMYTPANMPDLTIDRSQISGTIAKSDGKLQWNLTGPAVNWTWNNTITMSATIGISNKCPFDDANKCPASNSVFVTMPEMTLGINALNKSVDAVGGFSLSQPWMRIEASTGDLMLNPDNGVKNSQVVMWVGKRNDSFNEAMQLPDLGSLNKGLNAEFCGDFSLKIPRIANKATSGCARWSTAGFVVGQIGTGGEISTSYSSPDLDVSGSSVTKVAGAAFNTLSSSVLKSLPNPSVMFDGAKAKLANASISIGGTTEGIPGKLLKAIGRGDAAIKELQGLPFKIGGLISADSLDLTASVPLSGTVGGDPMTLKIQELQMNLSASTSGNASLSVSVVADTTFGYGTTSAPFTTTISLIAQAGTDTGLGLVVNAHGVPSAVDSGRTGNTNGDKLTDPQNATWVWKNAFDIPGYNLWNMTTQIGFFGGSPQFGYNATGYLDPTNSSMDKLVTCGSSNAKQTLVGEKCSGGDWLMSQLVTSISATEPCFAWSFDGGSTGTTLSVSNGVMRTQKFKIGFSPLGCTVGTDDNKVTLPPAFAGFQFNAQIGSALVSFIFKTSVDGFTSVVDLQNVILGPVKYEKLNLTTNIKKDGSSDTSFVADMVFPSGKFAASGELMTNSKGMYQHVIGDVDVEGGKGSWSYQDNSDGGKQRFSIKNLHFEESIQVDDSGSATSIDLSGKLTMKNKEYDLVSSYIRSANGVLSALHFEVIFTHDTSQSNRTARFKVDYKLDKDGVKFVGRFDLGYNRRWARKINSYTYERHLDINIYMEMDLDLGSTDSSAVFLVGGNFDADNISGGMDCKFELSTDSDFHCRGRVTFYKKDLGHFHSDWSF